LPFSQHRRFLIDGNAGGEVLFGSSCREASLQRLRAISAAVLSVSLLSMPVWGATTPSVTPLGTIIAADHAHVGERIVDVGTTLYGGDRISTELQGSVQVRTGQARLLLLNASAAIVNDAAGAPSAKLLQGTATFSTGNAYAFTLFASKAAIRPQTDTPTVGQVTYLNEKELLITARRGPLTVTVEDETQVIPEGTSYRVLLDPALNVAQGPEGAGQGGNNTGQQHGPLKAGRSRFLIIAITTVAVATAVVSYIALESNDRP
jgi:hypothetical protein